MIQEKKCRTPFNSVETCKIEDSKRVHFHGKKARKKAFNDRRLRRRRCPRIRNRCSMSKCNKVVYRCVGNYLEM